MHTFWQVVEDAAQFLVTIGAATTDARSSAARLNPTQLGFLMAALPMDIEQCKSFLHGAEVGLLYEAAVVAGIKSTRPYTIKKPFGQVNQCRFLICKIFCCGVCR